MLRPLFLVVFWDPTMRSFKLQCAPSYLQSSGFQLSNDVICFVLSQGLGQIPPRLHPSIVHAPVIDKQISLFLCPREVNSFDPFYPIMLKSRFCHFCYPFQGNQSIQVLIFLFYRQSRYGLRVFWIIFAVVQNCLCDGS